MHVALAQYELLVSYLKIFLINASRQKLNHALIKKYENAKEPLLMNSLKGAIDANYKKMHSPADYASLLNISAKALNRVVKSHFNKTLTHLITERILI